MNTQYKNICKEIQKLNIELFFCDELSHSFRKNAEFVLNQRGIENKYIKLFPDVTSESFKVESYGRRFLIAKEISKRYKVFFKKYLNVTEVNINSICNSQILRNYFSSNYFLYNKVSFPHYTGAGGGMENSSKFFFFAIDYLSNRLDEQNESLLIELYTAFAIHIHFHAGFSDLQVYQSLKSGVFFQIGNQAFLIHQNMRIKLDEKSLLVIKLKYRSLNSIIETYIRGERL